MKSWYEWREAPKADFAVLGDPISHSLSPRMHQAAFTALGLPLRYVALRVPQGELVNALEFLIELGYQGVNLTLPLKAEGMALATSADEFSKRCGAINTIALPSMNAINTDGLGFLEALRVWNLPHPTNALVMGAGGSARAVVLALSEEDHRVKLWNRTQSKAASLLKELEVDGHLVEAPDLLGQDLLVDCTGASLLSEPIQLDWTQAQPSLKVLDLVYSKSPTSLLQEAARHNLACQDGKRMLVSQGALALEFWLNKKAPRTDMLRAIT